MSTNEDKIILKLKSSEGIIDAYGAQTLNYLKATKLLLEDRFRDTTSFIHCNPLQCQN